MPAVGCASEYSSQGEKRMDPYLSVRCKMQCTGSLFNPRPIMLISL